MLNNLTVRFLYFRARVKQSVSKYNENEAIKKKYHNERIKTKYRLYVKSQKQKNEVIKKKQKQRDSDREQWPSEKFVNIKNLLSLSS